MKTLTSKFRATVLCSLALLTLTLASPAFGQFRERSITPPRADSQFLFAFRDATVEAAKSTVRVLGDKKEVALGTIVGADGWILTKYSELIPGKPVFCKLKDGKTLEAKVIGVHDGYDLAMLKVDAKDLLAVKFTPSKEAPVGNWLASAGLGDDPLAVGVMSVAARHPVADPHDMLNPNRGYLGIEMEKIDGGGVKIKTVNRRTPADRAGLKVGDRILTVNEEEITSPESMQKAMSKTKAGDEVAIKIKRKDEEMELKAKLAKVPQDRSDFQNSMGTDVAPLSGRRHGFPTIFQHDSLVPAKDCGGPVCDLDGHVVGINIARAGRTETYAIPAEDIKPLLADLGIGQAGGPKESEPVKVDTDKNKKLTELKAALKKAEDDKAAAEKKLAEAQDELKKQEAAKAEAEKKLKDAKEALDKAEKEAKDKK